MPRTSHHRRASRLLLLLGALAAVAAVWTSAAQASLWPVSTGRAPYAVAIADDGSVYTVDTVANAVSRILDTGIPADVPWPVASSTYPTSIAIDAAGRIWTGNLSAESLTRIDPTTGVPVTIGDGTNFNGPHAIAIGPDGSLYVANYGDDSIAKVQPGGVIASGAWPVHLVDPTLPDSFGLTSIAVGADGTIYVGDTHSTPNKLWKVSADGVKATSAWPVSFSGGMQIADITVGPDGSVYVSDFNHGVVQKVSPDGTIASGGWPATVDPATSLAGTTFTGLTVDSAGNVYATAYDVGRVARISPLGVMEDLGSVDVGANPNDIAIGADGSLYTANLGSNSVSKLTQTGEYHAPPAVPSAPSAVAGSGTGSATVTITPNAVSARFGAPTSYTVSAVRDATKHCTITAPATSCTVTGLTGGTSYTFTATATLQAWTTASSSASLPVTAKSASPGRPTVAWSKTKRTVTALITPVAGVTYALTATKGATTKTGTCKAVTVKGKARRRCTITLPTGTWRLAVTPTRAGTAGTAATKTYTIG